jgi:crossover junction endodeoxyribonuclease RuvC
MILFGIDPGLACTGYACISENQGKIEILDTGTYKTKKNPIEFRLKEIYDFFSVKISEFNVDQLAIEKIFFSKNVKTALMIEEVRGILMLLSTQMGISVFQYTPLEVKCTLTMYGRASKLEVKMMVERMIDTKLPKSDDACDAVAIALCHLYSNKGIINA